MKTSFDSPGRQEPCSATAAGLPEPTAASASNRSLGNGARLAVLLAAALVALLPGLLPTPGQGSSGFVVVGHQGVPDSSLTRSEVSDIFLLRTHTWSDGTPAKPVTQETRDLDEAFCREIHGRSVASVKKFWQRQIFTGRGTPPPERDSDSAVLSYVRSTPGAIGYVSSRASLGSGVKQIQLR